jgi:hypothetical protein
MQLIIDSEQLNLRPLVGEIQSEGCSISITGRNRYDDWTMSGEVFLNHLNPQPMVREIIRMSSDV